MFGSLTVAFATAADRDTSIGPCDALADYLRGALAGPVPVISGPTFIDLGYEAREKRLEDSLRSTSPTAPLTYARRVTPVCRAETRREDAPAAVAAREAARAWTQRSERGWIDRGRIVRCAMQDFPAYNVLADWMADYFAPESRAVCASALATWPDSEHVRADIFARALRENHTSWAHWEVDEAVVAAANVLGTAELREQLVGLLVAAHTHQALGYDRLREAVCASDATMSSARARACSTLPAAAEHEWTHRYRRWQWTIRGVGAVAGAGLVTAAFLTRHQADSRRIPTAVAIPGGAIAGIDAAVLASIVRQNKDDEDFLPFWVVGGMLGGAVVGGLGVHELAAWPGARAPLTALAFAPIYMVVLGFTTD